MPLEPMTLIERLRNPAWESDGLMVEEKPACLNIAQTVSDMEAAARENERLRAALSWYGDEAEAIARNLNGAKVADKAQAVEASLTVLALDGGRRARIALTHGQSTHDVLTATKGD